MPAPHRLSSLYRADPERAAEELRNILSSNRGNVAHAAAELGVGVPAVQAWIASWGLRGWLESAWPASQRIAEAQKNRQRTQK